MDRTYLLVLGTPRSGTTLLNAMIGCHDDVAMLNEDLGSATRLLIGKRVVGNKLCVPNQIELEKRGGPWRRRLRRYGLFQYSPAADLSLEDYLAWEPLKTIAILRDGNAVISSIVGRGRRSDKLAAYRWCRGVEIIHALAERRPGQTLLLTFEQLVSEPRRSMLKVAEYLGLEFQEKMLEGWSQTPNYADSPGIDAGKARPPERDFRLEERFPDQYRKYRELVARSGL